MSDESRGPRRLPFSRYSTTSRKERHAYRATLLRMVYCHACDLPTRSPTLTPFRNSMPAAVDTSRSSSAYVYARTTFWIAE